MGWVAITCGSHIHSAQRTNPHNFMDPPDFPSSAPSRSKFSPIQLIIYKMVCYKIVDIHGSKRINPNDFEVVLKWKAKCLYSYWLDCHNRHSCAPQAGLLWLWWPPPDFSSNATRSVFYLSNTSAYGHRWPAKMMTFSLSSAFSAN